MIYTRGDYNLARSKTWNLNYAKAPAVESIESDPILQILGRFRSFNRVSFRAVQISSFRPREV
jgi:hypothetical protein